MIMFFDYVVEQLNSVGDDKEAVDWKVQEANINAVGIMKESIY